MSRDAACALHAWRFCGGWNVDRLILYDAMHSVDDWDMTVELLMRLAMFIRES